MNHVQFTMTIDELVYLQSVLQIGQHDEVYL